MRLALNAWFLNAPATGTGQYLRHLVRALGPLAADAGVEMCLVAPRAEPDAPAPLRAAPPFLAANENLGKVEFEHIVFPRECRRARATLAHVPHFGPPLYPSVPTVVTIHDLIPLVLPAYRGSLAVRLYTDLAARGARRARLILADSQASRRDIIDRLNIPGARVRVVYLAAEARFRPVLDADERARVRAKYGLPERFILYLGGFDARKNVRVLVEAFGGLEREHAAGSELVVAGRLPPADSSFFPDPRRGAGAAVRFIGYVAEEDKPALYSLARAFAFPSLYEGFGLPPLEALACGLPVLCADSGSLPEVMGAAGILLNPREVAAWTEALRRVLDDDLLCQELRGRALVQSARFSWERTARATLDAYHTAQVF